MEEQAVKTFSDHKPQFVSFDIRLETQGGRHTKWTYVWFVEKEFAVG